MNRWIRGKEIKAEAEWTARWVFRYDKSPRKSSFLRRSFFPLSSAFLRGFASPRIRIRPLTRPLPSPPLISVASFSPFLFLRFFPLAVLSDEEVTRLFDSRIDIPMRGSRVAAGGRAENSRILASWVLPSTVIETPFPSLQSESRIFLEIFRQPVPLACRFQVPVKIVDFNAACASRFSWHFWHV